MQPKHRCSECEKLYNALLEILDEIDVTETPDDLDLLQNGHSVHRAAGALACYRTRLEKLDREAAGGTEEYE